MASPIFENSNSQTDPIGGMEIYPGGRGALDISDDAIRKMEDGGVVGKRLPDILSRQLDPEHRSGVVKVETVPQIINLDPSKYSIDDFATDDSRGTGGSENKIAIERDATDLELEDKALQAFYDGDSKSSVKYFSEIKDKSLVQEQLQTVIAQMAAGREYKEALQLVEFLQDPNEREKERKDVLDLQRKYAPTITGDLDEEDKSALEADFGAFPKDEGRKVDLKIIRDSKPVNEDVDTNMSPDIPSAVEIAMRETNRFVEAKTVPPEIPPTVEAGATNPPTPETSERSETVEANFEALREARDAYATAYAEWEYQTRHSTKLWQKTMFALGASKPAPDRLTLRTTALEDAKEAYLKARVLCGKGTTNTYQQNYYRGTEESLLLQGALQQARENREASDAENKKMADEMLPKGTVDKALDKMADTRFGKMLKKANNVWLKVPGKTIVISSTLVAGGTVFAGAGLGYAAYVGGLRVARAGGGILGAKLFGSALGKYHENKNEKEDEVNIKEYAGAINEENFPEWEAKEIDRFENNENMKRRQRAVKIGAMIAAGGASGMATGSILGSIFGTPHAEAVASAVHEAGVGDKPVLEASDKFNKIVEAKTAVLEAKPDIDAVDALSPDYDSQIHALKVDILSKYHGGEVPPSIQKNILDVPTDKLLEKFQLVDNAHNSSAGNVGGHIAFDNGRVVYEQGGIKRDLYDPNIDIGTKPFSKVAIGDPTIEMKPTSSEDLLGDPITTADELKPADPGFGTTELHSPEPVMVDETKIGVGETLLEQAFEGGKISVIHGTPTDPNHISMVLDGKEFAVGTVKDGVPNIAVLPEFKGGWFTSTVYERAFDAMKSRMKPDILGIK